MKKQEPAQTPWKISSKESRKAGRIGKGKKKSKQKKKSKGKGR